jgi:ferredoxin
LTKIYFFSGTGNNLWSAEKIASIICGENKEGLDSSKNCELYNIGSVVENEEIIIEADAVVIVFPSYAYGLPLVVRRFIKRAVFKTPYLASFVTYGSSPKGTLGAMRRIIKKKGINKLFFGRIPAVENYLAIFGTPKPATIANRVLLQERATEEAAHIVINRTENKVNTFTPFSSFVSFLFYFGLKIFYRHYRLSKDCTGCGSCEKICPVFAIIMKDDKPVFTKKCEHCQGCINTCPHRAIQFGRVKHGTPGYCHPGIDLRDLSARR